MTCRPTCIQPSPSNAHCAADGCHRTFGGITGFDRHRRGGECLDPAGLGMHPRPAWRLAHGCHLRWPVPPTRNRYR